MVADAGHLRPMQRMGIRYDFLAYERHILRLHFWDWAFELLKCRATEQSPDARHRDRVSVGG